MCCINNQDIIFNQNYPNNAFNSKSMEIQYQSLNKEQKERFPSNQILLGNARKNQPLLRASMVPICSNNIIVQKKGDPFQDYEVLEKLGEGTFGKVFKVKNKNNNCIRAMKQIGKKFIGDLNDSEVLKEIEILKQLNHPYIMKLYEYYVNDDNLFLISELCDEGDLQKKIVKIGKFPEFIVKIIMFQVFKALMYLSEKYVIHGDLKLENILVVCYENKENDCGCKNKDQEDGFINAIKHDIDILLKDEDLINSYNESSTFKKDNNISSVNKKLNERHKREDIHSYKTNFQFGRNKKNNFKNESKKQKLISIYDEKKLNIFNYGIKLIDFGCSKIFTRYRKSFNDIIGTLVYCSPEVLANDYNAGCDIWACGVLMYCLLSGHFPFYGKNEEEITSKILSGKFEFDIELFNDISEEAKDLITKCLKYDVSRRITVEEAINHKFFYNLNYSSKFTEDEIKKLKSIILFNKNSKFYQLVFTYLSYNFSDNKLLNDLNNIYFKIDKNSDWKITKVELFKAYKLAGIDVTQEQIENLIKTMDFDKDGKVNYEEFIRICIPKEKLFTEQNLENAFNLFDKNKNGFITPSEIIDIIVGNRNISEEVKNSIKEEILQVADEIIDVDEFKSLMLSLSGLEK